MLSTDALMLLSFDP